MALFARYRTILFVLGSAVLLYALVGFLLAPYAIKTYGIPALSERLRHPVLLSDIRINPFACSLTLSEFEIQEPDGTPMLGFQELYVNFEVTSLVRSAYLFDEILLTLPFGLAHVQTDGQLNLLGLVPPPEQPTPAAAQPVRDVEQKPIPPVEIRLLSIRQGVLEFRDDSKSKPATIDVVPIEVTVRNFATKRGNENAYAFSAEFGAGETLAWEGTVYLDPLESTGQLSLGNLDLTTFWPSVRDRFRFTVQHGVLSVDARYHLDLSAAPVNLQLHGGKVTLADFRLAPVGEAAPVVTVPSFTLDGIEVDLPKRQVALEAVRLEGADIRAWLGQDGVVNFKPLFTPIAEEPPREPKPVEQAAPWTVDVGQVEVAKMAIGFEDRSLPTTAELQIDDLQLSIRDVHVPFRGTMPVEAKLRLNDKGTIESSGTVGMDPLRADLTVTMAHLGIPPFQPYLVRVANIEVRDGEVESKGEVRYRSRHEAEPLLRYVGKLGVNNLHVADPLSQTELLGWTALAVNNVTLEVEPTKVKIGEIAWRDPSLQFVMTKDGSSNLSHVMKTDKPDAATAEPAAKPTPTAKQSAAPTPIEVDVVTLSKLSATFVDESIEPAVMTGIQDFSGTIKGLSSKQLARAEVALAGKVDNIAPLKVQGRINPLSGDAFTDLTFLFQAVDLTTVSPYAGKYVGYPITKGKLSLDLKYHVSKQQLVGENKVLIDQFTFGDPVESPDATNLPVRLAVALLKDRRGRIDIDLPVRGDLSEPDFRYGRVVLNALTNLITKVATSPFTALGGLVGGGGEDLQFIQFAAGAEDLAASERQKLDAVAKALAERPALRVEVVGAVDSSQDREALALKTIQTEVQRRFTQGGTKNVQSTPSPEREFELLSDLYAERLGKPPTKREQAPEGKVFERVLTVDELRQELWPAMGVDEGDLRALAQARAKAIREYVLTEGKLTEDRVFLVDVEVGGDGGASTRSHLNLTGS
ncbi:MAG: hypothetical protein NBKEAIPA_00981 [Nitrospirae bacterium]|nr:hypothetical protein [Nitrospirota bacterium]MCK6493300.1 DUF748 domain-containing protein [Nitrospira sp.]QOJ33870.1 MAG: DUF748 domain-containing protein [Nitrospira sp.]